jgi:hypothetical protein
MEALATAQDMEVVDATEDELRVAIDEQAREIFGISGEEYLDRLRNGNLPEDPAAIGLHVLARAFIQR